MVDGVYALKVESLGTGGNPADERFYPDPINPIQDALVCRRIYLLHDTSVVTDRTVYVDRDSNGRMLFIDPENPGGRTLSQVYAGLSAKSGKVLAASFSGTPRKATVTFTAAYPDTNYSIVLTPILSTLGLLYTPNVETQLADSFVINMGTSLISNLVSVAWSTMAVGE